MFFVHHEFFLNKKKKSSMKWGFFRYTVRSLKYKNKDGGFEQIDTVSERVIGHSSIQHTEREVGRCEQEN